MKNDKDKLPVTIDTRLHDKLKMIKKKLASLNDVEKTVKTNGALTIAGMSINVSECTDIKKLILVGATLNRMQKDYDTFADSLTVKEYPQLLFNGYTAKEWINSIDVRIQVIHRADLKKTLQEKRAQLENFFSEEDKKALLFKELEDLGI